MKIPLERTIAHRPGDIARRQEIGHWESDLLIFQRAHGKANVTSLVERKSRLTRLIPNTDRRSLGVVQAIGEALAALPSAARQTITFDRGSEFLAYDHLAKYHDLKAYFCDPHSPWQKGGVENANGRGSRARDVCWREGREHRGESCRAAIWFNETGGRYGGF